MAAPCFELLRQTERNRVVNGEFFDSVSNGGSMPGSDGTDSVISANEINYADRIRESLIRVRTEGRNRGQRESLHTRAMARAGGSGSRPDRNPSASLRSLSSAQRLSLESPW